MPPNTQSPRTSPPTTTSTTVRTTKSKTTTSGAGESRFGGSGRGNGWAGWLLAGYDKCHHMMVAGAPLLFLALPQPLLLTQIFH